MVGGYTKIVLVPPRRVELGEFVGVADPIKMLLFRAVAVILELEAVGRTMLTPPGNVQVSVNMVVMLELPLRYDAVKV